MLEAGVGLARQLRALDALQSTVSSTHIGQQATARNSRSRVLVPSSGLYGCPHTRGTHISKEIN